MRRWCPGSRSPQGGGTTLCGDMWESWGGSQGPVSSQRLQEDGNYDIKFHDQLLGEKKGMPIEASRSSDRALGMGERREGSFTMRRNSTWLRADFSPPAGVGEPADLRSLGFGPGSIEATNLAKTLRAKRRKLRRDGKVSSRELTGTCSTSGSTVCPVECSPTVTAWS